MSSSFNFTAEFCYSQTFWQTK